MGFSFNTTAGASQPTFGKFLAGNKIHKVKFIGAEAVDIKGSKDPSMTYKVLKLKFSNEDGMFEHTVFEPRESDFARGENEFVDQSGKRNKIVQPSNVESMMLLFKHAIDIINPEIGKAIDNGEKKLEAPNWDSLRKLVVKILEQGINTELEIKLLENKKGVGVFPGFFASVNREGKAYIRNGFIGHNLAFTPYEAKKIQNAQNATPTKMSEVESKSEELPEEEKSDDGFSDFSIANL